MKQSKWFIQILAVLFASFFSLAQADGFSSLQELGDTLSGGEPELLKGDEAFVFSSQTNGDGQLLLNWKVAPNYYLYQEKIKVKVLEGSADIGELNLPPAKEKMDEVFNKIVKAYHHSFSGSVPLTNLSDQVKIQLEFQGCADIGVCYPPMRKTVALNAASFGIFSAAGKSDSLANPAGMTSTPSSAKKTSELSETDQITDTLINSSVWVVIATFFVFGLLLSLTPCVFPMIPILSSIIIGQGDQLSTRRAFTMSLVYVLAMSITYTVAGVLAGVFGENLQVAFQNPWIIGSFSLIFILLALSMFGFYELQLPSAVQSKITNLSNKQQGGTLTGVAIMGFLSALIVGPCVAPPLAGALIYIGQTGDALLGGTALFAMSMGMGIPLLLLGTSAGKLLPRAGAWMDNVKAVFGVLMIAVAIWMAERILPESIVLFAWAALLIGSAVYLGALEPVGEKPGWVKLFKSFGVIMLALGVLMLVGLAGGSKSVLTPLKIYQGGSGAVQSDKLPFKTIKTLADLEAELKTNPKVMLDFYADWCISCKEMEAQTFSTDQVHTALQGVTLLKADVTQNDAEDKALMKAFDLIGPPAIMFFKDGLESSSQRVVGFKNADDFVKHINNGLHE